METLPSRRGLLLGATLSLAAPHIASQYVRAQSFPSRPIKLVVPYSPITPPTPRRA